MRLLGTSLLPYARRVAAALISHGMPFEGVNGYREIASRRTDHAET
jgi:hypothetical protein